MISGAFGSAAGGVSNRVSGAARLTSLALASAVVLLLAAAPANAAQSYTAATPLSTGKATSSVAVNQANGDLYAASLGTTNLGFFQSGSLKHFNSSGTEIACSLSGLTKDGFNATHPASVAVDPETEDVYVGNVTTESTSGLYDFPAACGSPNAIAEGSGDTHETSTEITSVSTSSGAFEVGQFLSGTGIPASTAIVAIGAGSLTLSAAATADGTGVALSSTSFNVGANNGNPVPQGATDSEGNLYWPEPTSGKVRKFAPGGEEIELAHPIEGLTKPASVALDAAGDLYVASGVLQCSEPEAAAGTLQKYAPDGELLETFAGLTSEVSTVALDRSTGDVFVGRGCGSTTTPFRVEKYSPGGTKLAEFGEGLFLTAGGSANLALNQLAVDEASGTVYAADAGHGKVQVFSDTSTKVGLPTGVTPASSGEVLCNGTPCKSEYDEGSEITVLGEPEEGYAFKEWVKATGSAAGCLNTSAPCVISSLDIASELEAEFGPAGNALEVIVSGGGEVDAEASPAPVSGEIAGCEEGTGECEALYAEGEVVTLVETAHEHFEFSGWGLGDCESEPELGHKCVVTMSAAKEVHASFARIPHELEVELTGPGKVSAAPGPIFECEEGGAGTCTGTYGEGETIVLTASALPAHYQVGWAGVSCTVETATECQLEMPEANAKVEATSDRIPHELEVELTGPGKVSAAPGPISECEEGGAGTCAGTYGEGEAITLTATALPAHYKSAGRESAARSKPRPNASWRCRKQTPRSKRPRPASPTNSKSS